MIATDLQEVLRYFDGVKRCSDDQYTHVFPPYVLAAGLVLSGTSPAFTKQSRRGFEIEERSSGSSPVRLSHLFSLAVIIVYNILRNISISKANKYIA